MKTVRLISFNPIGSAQQHQGGHSCDHQLTAIATPYRMNASLTSLSAVTLCSSLLEKNIAALGVDVRWYGRKLCSNSCAWFLVLVQIPSTLTSILSPKQLPCLVLLHSRPRICSFKGHCPGFAILHAICVLSFRTSLFYHQHRQSHSFSHIYATRTSATDSGMPHSYRRHGMTVLCYAEMVQCLIWSLRQCQDVTSLWLHLIVTCFNVSSSSSSSHAVHDASQKNAWKHYIMSSTMCNVQFVSG